MMKIRLALNLIDLPSLMYIYIYIYVPDHVGTLAQVGNSPNLGWPNKELRGSRPIQELFCPSWDPLGIPIKQSLVVVPRSARKQ